MTDHDRLHDLIQSPPEQVESILSGLLDVPEPDLAQMARWAGGLFAASRHDLASRVFRRWTELRPQDPEPWSNLGLCLLLSRQAAAALEALEQALALDDGYAPAMNNLCDVYKELGLPDRQLQMALAAVAQQPGSAQAFNNLGSALRENGRFDEALHAYNTSLLIDPANFEARFNKACVAADAGEHAEALSGFAHALEAPGIAQREQVLVAYHRAYSQLALGQLQDGWRGYESGFSPWVPLSLARRPDRQFDVPRWQGQPLAAGQRLLIWREQGIGDELRFATLLRALDVGAGQVILETEPRLAGMLRRSFPSFVVREQAMSRPDGGSALHKDFEYQLPIGSLPQLLMQDRRLFGSLGGYLQPSADAVARIGSRLSGHAGRQLVGLCWRSHQLSVTRNRKYTTLEDWGPVLSRPDTIFVNLQYGDCEQEIAAAEQALRIRILRWADIDLKDDLETLLGILHHLDLVITPSTAVLGFAGAMGRPTLYLGHQNWLMLGETERYPWYASVMPLVVPPTQAVATTLPAARVCMDQLLH